MPRGGPRPNSGPAKGTKYRKRETISPEKTPDVVVSIAEKENPDKPLSIAFLEAVVSNSELDVRTRLDAAKTLAPFQARKAGETGKKDDREKKAKETAKKFATNEPPRLVKNG